MWPREEVWLKEEDEDGCHANATATLTDECPNLMPEGWARCRDHPEQKTEWVCRECAHHKVDLGSGSPPSTVASAGGGGGGRWWFNGSAVASSLNTICHIHPTGGIGGLSRGRREDQTYLIHWHPA